MKPVTVLHREGKPLNRLGLLSVGLDTVIGQDRCLLGRERPPGLIRPPRHRVQLVAARCVQEGIGLGQPHAELIQHVREMQ